MVFFGACTTGNRKECECRRVKDVAGVIRSGYAGASEAGFQSTKCKFEILLEVCPGLGF